MPEVEEHVLPAAERKSEAEAGMEPVEPQVVTAANPDTEEVQQKERDNDIIRWPDEGPPKKEVWEVEPRYDWEKDERG